MGSRTPSSAPHLSIHRLFIIPCSTMVITKAIVGDYFGYLGLVVTAIYMLSPAPTAWKIHRARDAQGFSPVPYIVGVFNCSLWVYYTIITIAATGEDLRPNMYINLFGVLTFGSYVLTFIAYSVHRYRVLGNLAITLLLLALCIAIFEKVVPNLDWDFHWGDDTMPLKSSVCGVMTDILNILLYGSPLIVMKEVIRTRSVEFMPLPLSLLTFVVSVLWCFQGVLIGNITVLIPNGLGVFLGFAQLGLYAMYFKSSRQGAGGEESLVCDNIS